MMFPIMSPRIIETIMAEMGLFLNPIISFPIKSLKYIPDNAIAALSKTPGTIFFILIIILYLLFVLLIIPIHKLLTF